MCRCARARWRVGGRGVHTAHWGYGRLWVPRDEGSQMPRARAGYSTNAINVWRYPGLQRVATLSGHTQRVLYLATSPDGRSIVTGAGAPAQPWECRPWPTLRHCPCQARAPRCNFVAAGLCAPRGAGRRQRAPPAADERLLAGRPLTASAAAQARATRRSGFGACSRPCARLHPARGYR